MPANTMWGWSPDDDKWVKLQLDSDGSIHVVGYVDKLSDIGDVTVAGIATGMCIYWDAGTSTWKVKQFLPLAGGTMAGAIAMGTNKITGLGDPTLAQDAATRAYVLARCGLYLPLAGGTMAGSVLVDTDSSYSLGSSTHRWLGAHVEHYNIIQALPADHRWSGNAALMTAGTALTIYQACYVGADSKMEKALATAAATMPAIALATGTIDENASGTFILQGFVRDDTWDWTPGGLLYVSRATAGALTQTLPALTGEQVQVVGVAITADIIYFNPSYELVEIS